MCTTPCGSGWDGGPGGCSGSCGSHWSHQSCMNFNGPKEFDDPLPRFSMIQRKFQSEVWTLIIQNFTVIFASSMVLFLQSHHDRNLCRDQRQRNESKHFTNCICFCKMSSFGLRNSCSHNMKQIVIMFYECLWHDV